MIEVNIRDNNLMGSHLTSISYYRPEDVPTYSWSGDVSKHLRFLIRAGTFYGEI